MIVNVARSERLDHKGFLTSYTDSDGGTVAYLDETPDGTCDVFIYDAYTDRGRDYKGRTREKAVAIIERHIARLGHTIDPDVKEIPALDPDKPIQL